MLHEPWSKIALRFFALGILAVPAIENTGQYLFMGGETGFLVYPWVDAKALDQHAVSEHHALKIAEILAKMHCLNLDEPEIIQPEFYTHTNEKILELLDKAENFNCPFATDLRKNQENILLANEAYQNAILTLKQHIVYIKSYMLYVAFASLIHLSTQTIRAPIFLDFSGYGFLNDMNEVKI